MRMILYYIAACKQAKETVITTLFTVAILSKSIYCPKESKIFKILKNVVKHIKKMIDTFVLLQIF